MPNTVVFSLMVESALIIATTLLLTQPQFIFRKQVDKVRRVIKWGGLVLLCFTFCWSIVVGIVLSMNELSFRI